MMRRDSTTVTYATLPDTVRPGTWLKVVADDTLPGDRPDSNGDPTRMGQALQVDSRQWQDGDAWPARWSIRKTTKAMSAPLNM